MVLGRFIPFARTFVPIAAGIGRYGWAHFTLWNVIGSIAWTGVFIVAGISRGGVPFIRNNVELIAVIIIAASVIPIALGILKKTLSKTPESGDAEEK